MSETFYDVAEEIEGPTISVKDAGRLIKAAGIVISDDFLTAGIREGKFPFGFAIMGKEWRYWISLPKLVAWLRDWSGDA
jgi:hypothetical protein